MTDRRVRVAYASGVPQALAWSSAVITAVAIVLLLVSPRSKRDSPTEINVISQTPLPSVRCGPRTLEDHGVCVPVPQTHTLEPTENEGAWVPLFPGRPSELERYHLPTPGTAEISSVIGPPSAAPPSYTEAGDLDANGPVLELHTNAGARLDTSSFAAGGTAQVLAVDPGKHWLLLGYGSGDAGSQPSLLLLLRGMRGLTALTAGTPLSSTLQLPTEEHWTLMARQLRPGETLETGLATWSDERSIPTDPRNVLRPR